MLGLFISLNVMFVCDMFISLNVMFVYDSSLLLLFCFKIRSIYINNKLMQSILYTCI